MHLRTFTTLAAVTTTVSALAAPAPLVHHAIAAVGPEVTQPPSIQSTQNHGAFRAEPRPKYVDAKKLKKRDDDQVPSVDDFDVESDHEDDDFPTELSPTLKPLYTSCALAFNSLMTSAPEPSGKLEDWLETAIVGDEDSWTASSANQGYAAVCGTYTSPLTPPASLASTYSAYSSASASYLSAHQSEVTSLANACKPVYEDVLFSLMMPHKDYEECTSVYDNYMSVYVSLACAANTQDCSLTSAYPPKTTGTGAAAATTTTTAAGAGVTGASGSGSAGASSTTVSGNVGAPKQTFAAAAALAGLVAAVAAL
ncbi:hypothetical protein NCU04543 [Neurospora crassa OR74A]|uniref:Infection structure specific protein n=1 Tax=Neurospora crassa (strain ATCC 24698 / 74-OR23-1A / CBS 708.71 / DSM 1257 / FGSC 987) TaxID=367110 RepID=Q7RWG5_NEUCR|nr:hypothetical protein NCU04543 [Neurospora crassa OR74A]EAA26747.1 hypothetical protein NCU04543 [Neurospora crassa OR74A]|eukprot:XP_955983.1 hypothetical protein NCU04543 [Neurospora crassa OR74A]